MHRDANTASSNTNTSLRPRYPDVHCRAISTVHAVPDRHGSSGGEWEIRLRRNLREAGAHHIHISDDPRGTIWKQQRNVRWILRCLTGHVHIPFVNRGVECS